MTSPYAIWPLRRTSDPETMIDFFAALGLQQISGGPSGGSATFAGRSGRVGVQDGQQGPAGSILGRTTLNLVTVDVIAAAEEIAAAGGSVRAWADEDARHGEAISPSGLTVGLIEATQPDVSGGHELHEQAVAASMDVVAICTVADVAREAEFFAGFGFQAIEPGDGYLPLTAGPGSGVLGLRPSAGHAGPVAPSAESAPYLVDLGAETSEPFDALAARLQAAGYAADAVEDQSGVWIRVVDPDGQPLEIRPTR